MKRPRRAALRWIATTGVLWTLAAACRGGNDDLPLNPRPEEDPSFDGEAGGDQSDSSGSGGSSPINGGGSGGSGTLPGDDIGGPDAGLPPDAGPPSDAGTTDAGSDAGG